VRYELLERDAISALSHGSLFSGIGGFDLGFERAGFKTLWQVECEPYCLKVLEKHWPDVKRYTDVRSVHGVLAHAESGNARQPSEQEGRQGAGGRSQEMSCCLAPVDLISGGFPCQPFSVAGKRRGTEDDRYLWPQMRRVIEETRPRWVVAENVLGLITLALDQMLSDLEALGYTVGAVTLPACAVDAPHRRERLWVVGYARSHESGRVSSLQRKETAEIGDTSLNVADAAQQLLDRPRHTGTAGRPESPDGCEWLPEPAVCGVFDELSEGLDGLDQRIAHALMGYATSCGSRSFEAVPPLSGDASVQAIQRQAR